MSNPTVEFRQDMHIAKMHLLEAMKTLIIMDIHQGSLGTLMSCVELVDEKSREAIKFARRALQHVEKE